MKTVFPLPADPEVEKLVIGSMLISGDPTLGIDVLVGD